MVGKKHRKVNVMYTYAPGTEWSSVTQSLQKSLYAEQMVCSMSTQLFHIPETENLQGNREMHEHLVRASYHRVTATGSAVRLQTGPYHESIRKTLVSCIRNARKEDAGVREGLRVMYGNADDRVKPFIREIQQWQVQAEQYLAAAGQELGMTDAAAG